MSKKWSHPDPTEFLPPVGGLMRVIRATDLAAYPEQYPTVTAASFAVGQCYYSVHKVEDKGEAPVDWGYFAKVVDEDELRFRLQYVAGTEHLTGAVNDEMFVDVPKDCPDKFYRAAPEADDQDEAPAESQGEEAYNDLTKLIEEDPSIKTAKDKGDVKHRVAALLVALTGAQEAWTKDWPKEEAELAKYEELTGIVSEAIASAKETLQAKLSREDSSKLPAHYFGQSPTNMLVVARTLLKIKQNPAAPAKKPGKSQDIQAPLLHELRDIRRLLLLQGISKGNPIDLASQPDEPAAPTPQAGSTSCFGDGLCLYNALGGVGALLRNSQYDITKITADHERLVLEARCVMIDNWCAIAKFLRDKNTDPTKIAQGLFGRTEQEIFDHALNDEKMGGLLEAGLTTHFTDVEVRVIMGDMITEAASDLQLKGATQVANLEDPNLPGGKNKAQAVFLIVSGGKKQHYNVAWIAEGDIKKVFFKLGDEADAAHGLIINMLKKKNKKSITNLEGEERLKAIRGRIENKPKQVSYASVAAGQNKATQPLAPADADPSKAIQPSAPSKASGSSPERCRNFEKDGLGKCRFGEECKFEHDQSRSGKRRRKNIRQVLAEKRKIKEARSQNKRQKQKQKQAKKQKSFKQKQQQKLFKEQQPPDQKFVEKSQAPQ